MNTFTEPSPPSSQQYLGRWPDHSNLVWPCLLSPQYYKKTKQLPVLVKCCEEIQPHEWKAPVEREEHRLPFWLKVFSAALQKSPRDFSTQGCRGSCCLVHFWWVLLWFCVGFLCGLFLGGRAVPKGTTP